MMRKAVRGERTRHDTRSRLARCGRHRSRDRDCLYDAECAGCFVDGLDAETGAVEQLAELRRRPLAAAADGEDDHVECGHDRIEPADVDERPQ